MRRRLPVWLLLLLALPACLPPAMVHVQTFTPPSQPLPPLVVSTPDLVLWRAPDALGQTAVRLAKVTAGKQLDIRGGVTPDGFVPVHLGGALEVSGLARLTDLAVLVCAAGPIDGRFYAGLGNRLRLADAGDAGTVGVLDTLRVPSGPMATHAPYRQPTVPFTLQGRIDRKRLCTNVPKPRHSGTDADPHVGHLWGEPDPEDFAPPAAEIDIPAGVTLTVHDAPGGQVILTRAADPYGFVVLRVAQQPGWDQVAFGAGPYVLGWMETRPVRQQGPHDMLAAIGGVLGGSGSGAPWPLLTTRLKNLPLRKLAAGTQVQQYGQAFAVVHEEAWVRVGDLRDGWQYIHAAIDSDVVVEGWVRPDALLPVTTPKVPPSH